MSAHRSLIDATILELVLPYSTYPSHILFAILSDALSTTPYEEVRKFSQAVVDELGNLSILIEMRNMLEGPILAAGDEGKAWKEAPRRDPEGEGDAFYDAMQKSSTVASLKANEWQHLVWPLHQTKNETVLRELWEAVDTVRPLLLCFGWEVDSSGPGLSRRYVLHCGRTLAARRRPPPAGSMVNMGDPRAGRLRRHLVRGRARRLHSQY